MPAGCPVKARVAVIGGGQNCEHEVSLASAAAVAPAVEPSTQLPTAGRWGLVTAKLVSVPGPAGDRAVGDYALSYVHVNFWRV